MSRPDTDRGKPLPMYDALDEQQQEALRAAAGSGFFERPQQATADEVADTLGVSRSTFLYHLRAAEQTVFETAFVTDKE